MGYNPQQPQQQTPNTVDSSPVPYITNNQGCKKLNEICHLSGNNLVQECCQKTEGPSPKAMACIRAHKGEQDTYVCSTGIEEVQNLQLNNPGYNIFPNLADYTIVSPSSNTPSYSPSYSNDIGSS